MRIPKMEKPVRVRPLPVKLPVRLPLSLIQCSQPYPVNTEAQFRRRRLNFLDGCQPRRGLGPLGLRPDNPQRLVGVPLNSLPDIPGGLCQPVALDQPLGNRRLDPPVQHRNVPGKPLAPLDPVQRVKHRRLDLRRIQRAKAKFCLEGRFERKRGVVVAGGIHIFDARPDCRARLNAQPLELLNYSLLQAGQPLILLHLGIADVIPKPGINIRNFPPDRPQRIPVVLDNGFLGFGEHPVSQRTAVIEKGG